MVKCGLRVEGCGLRVASCGLRVEGYLLKTSFTYSLATSMALSRCFHQRFSWKSLYLLARGMMTNEGVCDGGVCIWGVCDGGVCNTPLRRNVRRNTRVARRMCDGDDTRMMDWMWGFCCSSRSEVLPSSITMASAGCRGFSCTSQCPPRQRKRSRSSRVVTEIV